MVLRTLVASLVVLSFPASALAGTAGVGFTPTFQADSSEANWLTVKSLASGKFEFHDLTAGMDVAMGCTSAFAGAGADCAMADPGPVVVMLDDRDDNFTSYLDGRIGAVVDGGTGNDHLAGGMADDVLSGDAGNDIVSGSAGNDVIDDTFRVFGLVAPGSGDDTQQGDQGDDTIVAGAGSDTIDGGTQRDTVDYSAYTAPVSVSVDAGTHDDGAAGEGDTVKSVERVLGGSGPDVLVAGAAASALVGGAGDDRLVGGAGPDTLLGDDEAGGAGSGNDVLDGGGGADALRGGDGTDAVTYASRTNAVTVTLDDTADDGEANEKDNVRSDIENVTGGAGADTLTGSAGANTLAGGPGNDHLTGAGGTDALDGGAGDDTIDAADGGPDAITCGAGEDTVNADAADAIAADCEHANRPVTPAQAPAPGGVATPAPSAPAVLLAGVALPMRAHGRVAVTLGCSGGTCSGRLTLRARGLDASASYTVAAGTIRTVTLKLSKAAQRRVRRAHRLAATLAAGPATVPVTLTAARR